jgi:hypothetical protein
MTDVLEGMPASPRDLAPEGTGVVGNRHLIAVQTIDIARLTTHPVPLVPGSFIVVTGQGPKGDSNGSGKTSFESAVSLLLAESQWRLEANGSSAAAGLLFQPESAGLSSEHQYPPAKHGYVIGVFADPSRPQETALTVWVRVARSSPYVRARWAQGIHVPTGESDRERYDQVDRLWDELPKSQELGPKSMARELYGTAPRCMAYLDTPLRKGGPSLLSQQMTEMNPARIGEALIDLTGRAGLLEEEESQRSRLAEQQIGLREKETEDARARVDEQADLDGVHHRDRARAHLAEGEHMWRLHFARGYLDVTATVQALTIEISDLQAKVEDRKAAADEARRRWSDLRSSTDLKEKAEAAAVAHKAVREKLDERSGQLGRIADRLGGIATKRSNLVPLKDAWTGVSITDAEAAAAHASKTQDRTRAAVVVAEENHARAEAELDAVRGGGGGAAGAVITTLAEAGVDAVALLDIITLTEDARASWEPRLWQHCDAVVIAPGDEDRALTALGDNAGATIVLADGPLDGTVHHLPDGVTATVPVATLLGVLAERAEFRTDPDRAHDATSSEFVVGGFTQEIAGRAARVATAEANVARHATTLAQARENDRLAALAAAATASVLEAAHAVAELEALAVEETKLYGEHVSLSTAVNRLRTDEDEAQRAWVNAQAAYQGHEQQIQIADARSQLCDRELETARANLATKRTDLDNQNLPYWQSGWGGSQAAAEALLVEQPDRVQTFAAKTLRGRAADALNDALVSYRGSAIELAPELQEAQDRRGLLRDGFGGVAGDSVDFTTLARPLRDLLDLREESDRVLEDRITRAQERRADEIEAAQTETERIQADLLGLQDAISSRIEASLRRISDALDRLNRGRGGFGAELRIVETRPETSTSPWTWEVTPRWRRSASGGLVSYKEVANGAQVKQIAIQLVLAALLAADGANGRVLILDELGNSLGDVNRKDVLSDLHTVAAEQQVTILGTCQDSVLADAAGVCGEILWFCHQAHSDAYNQPTRVWAYDDNGQRVELISDWLTAGRRLA